MLVDGFTVVAQIVNFLVLVWLLKRFLYRPVLAAIDAREKTIAAQLANAAARESQANQEREDFQKRQQALDGQREKLLQDARVQADTERKRLLDGALAEAEQSRQRLEAAAAAEQEEMGQRLAARIRQESLETTRRVLSELAGVGLEERMVEVFVEHLRGVPAEQRRMMFVAPVGADKVGSVAAPASGEDTVGAVSGRGAAPEGHAPGLEAADVAGTALGVGGGAAAFVRTAFEPTAEQRRVLESAVRECLPEAAEVDFQVVPLLVCGIELVVNGRKIAWSVSDSLARVERIANEL